MVSWRASQGLLQCRGQNWNSILADWVLQMSRTARKDGFEAVFGSQSKWPATALKASIISYCTTTIGSCNVERTFPTYCTVQSLMEDTDPWEKTSRHCTALTGICKQTLPLYRKDRKQFQSHRNLFLVVLYMYQMTADHVRDQFKAQVSWAQACTTQVANYQTNESCSKETEEKAWHIWLLFLQ